MYSFCGNLTIFTWLPPNACEWEHWRGDWWLPRSRWRGSFRSSSSGRRSPVCSSPIFRLFFTFSPQAGTKKERRSRLSRSSTLPLGTQNLCWLVCPLFFTTLGWFSKTAQVEIVHLANLGVCMNMIPSSQHAATCSLCVMRNWTGRLDYLPSLPALIPHGIPRSAFPMYCSLLWVAPPPVLLGPSISPWLCPLTSHETESHCWYF